MTLTDQAGLAGSGIGYIDATCWPSCV